MFKIFIKISTSKVYFNNLNNNTCWLILIFITIDKNNNAVKIHLNNFFLVLNIANHTILILFLFLFHPRGNIYSPYFLGIYNINTTLVVNVIHN